MLNEKNPLNAQALSDDDLDGVVGGVGGEMPDVRRYPDGSYCINGVTYPSLSAIPDDVLSEVKTAINDYCRAAVSGALSTCPRCGALLRTELLVNTKYGKMCRSCADNKLSPSDRTHEA